MSNLATWRLAFAIAIIVLRRLLFINSVEISDEYFHARYALIKKLTNESEIMKEILPVVDDHHPVNVQIHISLRQIAAVDERNQAIRLTVYLEFSWKNPYLRWDPKEYRGIDNVHVNSEHFWLPDIALSNQATFGSEMKILYRRMPTKLVINNDGHSSWNSPITLLFECKIDVSRFPFDEQECPAVFTSWTYAGNKINVTYGERKADLRNFVPNEEWEVKSATLHHNWIPYGLEKIPFPDVTFKLRIKRRPLYYLLNLVIPCTILSSVAFFTFVLPSGHGERITLVISVLLANSVYMLILSSSLPETSESVPILSIFCLCIITEIVLCLFATCLTLKLRELTCDMPGWVESFINKNLARLLCVNAEEKKVQNEINHNRTVDEEETFTKFSDCKNSFNDHEPNVEAVPLSKQSDECMGFEFKESILTEIRLVTKGLRAKQEEEIMSNKWIRAAKVLDRAFLVIFLLIYIVLILYLAI